MITEDKKEELKNSIIKGVENGLSVACSDTFDFYNFAPKYENKLISAEYLVTINVAKSIRKMERNILVIFLEEKTKVFSSRCTPSIAYIKTPENPRRKGGLRVKSKVLNTTRNGKIDMVIYLKNSDAIQELSSFCPIELKGFNPSKQKVIKDLQRNIEYLNFETETGRSSVFFTLFAALYSKKKL